MKNYYKILGVKETASEEEIRQRWIELSKLYHPDLGESSKLGEKIKEINEAYQMLKHSSTRVEYDLKRAYGQKKRGFNLKRLTLPISISIVFIIVGTIYFKMSRIPTFSKIVISNEVNQTNQIDQIDQTNQRNQINQKKMAQIETNNTHSLPPKVPNLASSRLAGDIRNFFSVSSVMVKAAPIHQIDDKTESREEIEQIKINPPQSETPKISSSDPEEATTQRHDDPIDTTTQWAEVAQIPAGPSVPILPKPLIATEEEVRQFINNYIARYTQKDIHGFLSFFSSKAIQNQKDGLEGIGKIYTDFFNMSQELQYRIEEMKIGIYQNAVEVKARYEVNQILKKGEKRKVWRGNVRWVLEREEGALKIISLDYQHEKSP
jgi:curved DNA-binding protein CbpA